MFVITNINIIKNTFNLFRQISTLDQETKNKIVIDVKMILNNFNHTNTTMKKGKLNSQLKTLMGHLKGI